MEVATKNAAKRILKGKQKSKIRKNLAKRKAQEENSVNWRVVIGKK